VVSFGAMLTPEPEVLKIAFDNGVNYVDTARKYMDGRNEEIVARALKGRRDKVYVATKTLPGSRSKEDIIRDVETSLKTLETDHIDVIQLHNLEGKERIFIPETREALAILKKQGKVRFCGVTTHKNQPEVLNALVDDKERFFDTCLVGYNFESPKDVGESIARAAKAGVGIIAMKTQAGGYKTEALGRISPHQAALKWALQNPNVTMAIPGMKDMAQLREDIAVMGAGIAKCEVDLMQPLDPARKPAVHEPPLNHVGLWVDDLPRAVAWLTAQGVRFAPGGIRKGAAGYDITFIHPRGSAEAPIGGEGVLIELVQAPPEVVAAFAALAD